MKLKRKVDEILDFYLFAESSLDRNEVRDD